jgi:hypothetical protein
LLVLYIADFNVDVPDAPLEGFLVCMEERIQLVSLDRPTFVEYFNRGLIEWLVMI